MSKGVPSRREPRFFDGFKMTRFVARVVGLFIAILAAGNEVADWSDAVAGYRATIAKDSGAIFSLFGYWCGLLIALESLRLKLRYDLAMLHWQRGRHRQPSSGRRL